MNKIFAFMDESGNTGLDFKKEGVSTHFIITAIIVDEESLPNLEAAVEALRIKHFQKGEIKSSSVGPDHRRRKRILLDLQLMDFHFFALVIDKRSIIKDSGLIHKKSFVKFLNNRLHNELRKAFPNLNMVSDEQGYNEFMDGFRSYVYENTNPTLFDYFEFGFEKSKDSIIIQLADFIAGTLLYVNDDNKKSSESDNFYKLLKQKKIRIEYWPPDYDSYLNKANFSTKKIGKYDQIISQTSLRQINAFIEKNEEENDPNIIEQVMVAKYLRFRFLESTSEYILTHEMLNELNRHVVESKMNRHYFRTKIIAKLRDKGVIIASSTRGYKLPASERDLYDFADHGCTVVIPMLDRIKKCRDLIKLATQGELDILDKAEYRELFEYMEQRELNL